MAGMASRGLEPDTVREPSVNQLIRGLDLIQVLVDEQDGKWGVREIARRLATSPSTAHRLLTLFAAQGMVAQDPADGRYRVGPRLYQWATCLQVRDAIARIARPHLKTLVDQVNETVLLGVFHPAPLQMMFVTAVESSHPLRYVVEVGTLVPLHTGASGLAILASLTAEQQETVLSRAVSAGVRPRHDLRSELERIRQRGYAVTKGERIPGAVGLAAAILDAADEVVGDVVVTIPEQRFDHAREAHLAQSVMDCAGAISRDLGRAKDVR